MAGEKVINDQNFQFLFLTTLIVFSSTIMHFKALVDIKGQISKYFGIVGAENINKFPKVWVIGVTFRQILFT